MSDDPQTIAALESLNAALWVCIWAAGIILLLILIAYVSLAASDNARRGRP